MYESPINKIMTDIQSRLVEAENGELTLKVKQSIGFDIDKEELVKALQYDRDQYNRGYTDGYDDARRTFSPKKGTWIPLSFDSYADGNPVWDEWACPFCQETHKGEADTLPDFCSNCGSDLREKE